MPKQSIAFVVPYGEASDGFLPDTLMALLCGVARDAGHDAALVHVYYRGDRAEGDARVRERLRAWIHERDPALVVVDRIFDVEPFRGRRVMMVSRGESFDPVEGVALWIGAFAGGVRRGVVSRRTPTMGELVQAFRGAAEQLARGEDPAAAPGVARIHDGEAIGGDAPLGVARLVPFHPALDEEVIAADAPPVSRRKTVFGNTGCPYGSDPATSPHHRGLALANDGSMARLGCAFCHMGGDYQKRPDEEVVAELVEQALVWTRGKPDVDELVLNDQHPMRYLAALMDAAVAAGVRPVRWLFAARADAFVRERERIEQAIAAAERAGQRLEVYLSGFEAFSDRELERYHKGTTVAEMVRAVEVMRELRRAHPAAFDYARARGHSLILWNPWTSPEDVAQSVQNVRAHGLRELFHELGRNRLRLYRDLPIHAAAERDEALATAWEDGDEGSARAKGYNPERPWRFLDVRTGLAHRAARMLRETLGAETEVAQLAAVTEWAARAPVEAQRAPAMAVQRIAADVAALRQALDALNAPARAPGAPARGATELAAVVCFAGACNNGCVSCANRDTWLDDSTPALLARIDAARSGPPTTPDTRVHLAAAHTEQDVPPDTRAQRASARPLDVRAHPAAARTEQDLPPDVRAQLAGARAGPRTPLDARAQQDAGVRGVADAVGDAAGSVTAIALAGREPTLHPEIERLVRAARGEDGRRVGVITNGRRFAYARFAAALVDAGLTAASVKLFGPDAARADAIARVDGAHAQALAGIRALRAAGMRALEIRVPLHRDTLAGLADYAAVASRAGAPQLRLEVALDALGLDMLPHAPEMIAKLAAACTRLGVALDASPLESATRHFTRIPASR